jgi:heme A synthase
VEKSPKKEYDPFMVCTLVSLEASIGGWTVERISEEAVAVAEVASAAATATAAAAAAAAELSTRDARGEVAARLKGVLRALFTIIAPLGLR